MNRSGLLASTLFHFVQAILSPLALVGYVLWLVRVLLYSRKVGRAGNGARIVLYVVDAAPVGHSP